MNRFDHLLAKGRRRGTITLVQHLHEVALVAVQVARNMGLDERIAYMGAILHDIGKASCQFQQTLVKSFPRPPGFIYRHEIGSLFFISLITEKDRPAIIDMVVAHHKSVCQDARGLGILDMIGTMDCFETHAIGFESWVSDALEILQYFGFEVKPITLAEARQNFEAVVRHCEAKTYGYSPWKGLLIAADHLASAMEGDVSKITEQLFIRPDLSYYNRCNALFPLSGITGDDPRRHTLLTAPTGAGKTDFLLKRCRGRVFYTLPFQASINAMYERIKNDLKNTTAQVHLLHAASALQMEGAQLEETILQRHIGASVKILTPHQLAALVFGTKGYEALIADIKGCDVILDEIHTYSDTMQAIVLKMVEILCALHCRVHIGTATMPSVLYRRLLHVMGGAEKVYEVRLPDNVLDTFNRHNIHKVADFAAVEGVIRDAIAAKEKILMVVNQVAASQELFLEMSGKYPDVAIMLIHGQFKRGDRAALETQLIHDFNKSHDTCIVVATQVVEVSLDISFGLMITAAAPIDALIQRFGRIYRVRTEKAKGRYKKVYVLVPPEDEKEARPYHADILKRSYAVLPDGGLLQERDLQRMIDEVYPEEVRVDIDLSTAFLDGRWRLKELWHMPRAALMEKFEMDSITCIDEADQDLYEAASYIEQTKLEIPVSYRAIAGANLRQSKAGSRPFVIPSKAYDQKEGFKRAYANAVFYNL